MKRSRSNASAGFTLIETVVGMLMGVIVVVAIGGLGQRLVHHRVTTDSNSAAMNLAEQQMEKLLAHPVANPEAVPNACPSNPLCAGAHTANLNADGTTVNPHYRVDWTVVNVDGSNGSPLVILTPPPGSKVEVKEITLTVTHRNNPLVHATLVTNYRMPE